MKHRSSRTRVRHAAHAARLSAGPVPVLRPRVSDHHLSDGSARSCASSCPNRSRSYSDLVKFEFIRMPDSTGFGDYTEAGQVIPVSFEGRTGNYTLCMFLNDHPPIAARPRAVGFPKKLAGPSLRSRRTRSSVRSTTGPSGSPPGPWATTGRPTRPRRERARCAQFPAQDHSARGRHSAHLRAGRVSLEDIQVKGVWTGPGALSLNAHALAPVAELPVSKSSRPRICR